MTTTLHTWTEVGSYKREEHARLVQCMACRLVAMCIGEEYVASEGNISANIATDTETGVLRFADHAPRLPAGDVCWPPLPMGAVVYHRSTQEWVTYEPALESTVHFIILAAQEGIVIDRDGRVESTSEDGRTVRLLLDPYEVRLFWSHQKPASVWERLRCIGSP